MLTYGFSAAGTDAGEAGRDVLGGKGAGLVDMVRLGLPVPAGFVIGTRCGREYLAAGTLPDGLRAELAARMADLEVQVGRRFGDDADPLLVSVRSGAPVSMPGMMDTVLNVGLTMAGAERLAMRDARFAWTSMERLLDGFARTVRAIGAGHIEDAFFDLLPEPDPALAARARCGVLVDVIEKGSGRPFPDPAGQLEEAIEAVFTSWRSPRAVAYRTHHGIDEAMGTAVVVQMMVFGNRDGHSGSGVAFTRDPSTGAPRAFGDFLFQAQGEDVVSGEHDTDPHDTIADRLPDVHAQLIDALAILERQARDLCDVEFTIESGRLYVLQTRVGQRSGRAAVALAVDLVDEGLITREEALARVTDEQWAVALAPRFDGEPDSTDVIARGLAASPGAVTGRAAFDPGRAQKLAAGGEDVVLLRPTTSPADLPGMLAAGGEDVVLLRPTTSPADLPGMLAAVAVVTGRGGRTSHAAVVARGLGRAAVCGVGELVVARDRASARLGGHELHEGELLSVDGDRGIVSRGRRTATAAAQADPALVRFESWRSALTTKGSP